MLGDLHGLNTLKYQPAKIAALEAHWETGKDVPLILFAFPDPNAETNHFEIAVQNPPKRYQDIYPLNFDSDPRGSYLEMLRVLLFWVERGVRIFRVDNPHTKPPDFWQWLIWQVKDRHPDVLFLAEAFTRPARLYGLARLGFMLEQLRADRLAQGAAQGVERGVGDVADGAQPERCSVSSVLSPTPHSAPTGSGWSEADHLVARHDQHAVGLGQARGELGDELGGRHADRAGEPCSSCDPCRAMAGRWRRACRAGGPRRRRRGTPRRGTAARPAG